MNLKNYVVITVTFLLLTFTIGSSVINYEKALKEMEINLKERSLPLSIDNIYSEVQKNIIEPTLVSSMMANDTFLKDWLIHEESQPDKISKYLESIKNRYGMFSTFLVSDKTGNYYTSKGLIEKVKKSNIENAWYFKFKDNPENHEINLDFNKYLADSLIMFINYKIFDDKFHYLGATGIGIKISYINEMLKHFRLRYNFNVFFTDKKGNVVLSENELNQPNKLINIKELDLKNNDLMIENPELFEYKKDGKTYILNSKFIKELNLFLFVEVKLDTFTGEVRKTFIMNLITSLFITIVIIIIILFTIKSYNKKLEKLALYDGLTHLQNRRTFNGYFEKALKQFKRDKIPKSIIFFDLDDFKLVNDNYGHLVGDDVLKRIAAILKLQIRDSDNVARWGGEEFLILLNNSDLEQTFNIAEKLRNCFENDIELNNLVKEGITASFGVSTFKSDDTIEKIISRADKTLYKVKNSGKNRVEKEI
jgi:diguanylate cyclase (GGDEF)-like protein